MSQLLKMRLVPVRPNLPPSIQTLAIVNPLPKPTSYLEHFLSHPSIIKNELYQDQISQSLLTHMFQSQKAENINFVKHIKDLDGSKRTKTLSLAEQMVMQSLSERGLDYPLQTVRLQLWGSGTYTNLDWKSLSKTSMKAYVEELISKLHTDRQGAKKIAQKYAHAISARNYGVVMDNEGDDLLYLLLNFEDGIFPKFIITYGGFTELRLKAVEAFVESASEHYNLPIDQIPKVYRGFPHPHQEDEHRHPYDYEEGSGFLTDAERLEKILESKALEKELTEVVDGKTVWKSDAWSHQAFKPGLDALRDMIDGSDYSAIAVLTCPASVTHVLEENSNRIRKLGVTMASPYSYELNNKGVIYSSTYNSRRQIEMMNRLLESGVDFLGTGGGTARTKGMRTIHDFKLGDSGSKLFSEKGLYHLEKVISPQSPFSIFRIIAYAGQNVVGGKWREWDEMYGEFWKYLNLRPPHRNGLTSLRKQPQFVLDLIRQENRKPREALKADQLPEVGRWELDRWMSILKIWYLWADELHWQAPSADLHATIVTHPDYEDGIRGAVGYQTEKWPIEYDEKGQPIKSDQKLNRFINSNHQDSNHYSISDMDLGLIKNRLQDILNKYALQTDEILKATPSQPAIISKSNL